MKNHLKSLLAAGDVAIGAQLRFGSPAIAELFGCAGFDCIVFDAEHAPQTQTGILSQIQGLASTRATPIIRVPKNDPELFRVYLDMGAGGILAPFVKTPEEVEAGAKACRYPPRGTRGFGPDRAWRYGFDDQYFDEADDQVLYMVLIETVEAVDAIDEILSVDGVDSYLVGPFDLSISLGVPRQFDHPRFITAVNKVFQAARKAGKPAGMDVDATGCTRDTFQTPIEEGYRLLLVDGDEWMLQAASQNVMNSFSQAKETVAR